MELVSKIRSDISRNTSHVTNKIFLEELREISRLFAAGCTSNDASDEEWERISIIRTAVRNGNSKKIHSLFMRSSGRNDIQEWRDLADLRPRKSMGGGL